MGDRFYEQQRRRGRQGSVTVAVDGLAEIERNLQKFNVRLQNNISRRALRAAANVIKTAIHQDVQSVPIDPGARLFLKRNIAVTVSHRPRLGRMYAKVRFRSLQKGERSAAKDTTTAPWYYHLFEFGRRPGSSGPYRWGMIPAYGFIRRGFQRSQQKVLSTLVDRFRVEIDKEGSR